MCSSEVIIRSQYREQSSLRLTNIALDCVSTDQSDLTEAIRSMTLVIVNQAAGM